MIVSPRRTHGLGGRDSGRIRDPATRASANWRRYTDGLHIGTGSRPAITPVRARFEGIVESGYSSRGLPMPRSARVQQVLEETATFTSAERAELVEELAKPILFTKADMDRQRKAILEFLAIPTFSGTDPNASSDKYAFLKHDIEA